MKKLIFIFAFLYCQVSVGQTWPKIFGIPEQAWGYEVIEYYDNGFLILGQVDPGFGGVDQMYGWLIKTDINGNLLWDKKIYHHDYAISGNDIYQTEDGGIVLTGVTLKHDPGEFDIIFMKLNACGEREWCTILTTPGNSDYGIKVKPVSDGYVGLMSYYQDWANKRVWIIKLDPFGNVIWRKAYFQDDPGYHNEEARDILITDDNGFLVTADGYYDPNGGWDGKLYSILIKTDQLGNEEWITRWGENDDYQSLLPMNPSLSESGNYFAANTHGVLSPFPGYVPAFIKTSTTGQSLFAADLLTQTEAGITTTLHLLDPDTLIMACGWRYALQDYQQGVIKCDTSANEIVVKVLMDSVMNTFQGSALTSDKKMVLVGGFTKLNNTSDLYIFKINRNLELDTFYTAQRTYDSLCPYQIVSDTIDMEDCGIYTALNNPDLNPGIFHLTAYPVPADDFIHFKIPEELLAMKTMNGVRIQTIYHQWDKTTMKIYDIKGQLQYESEIPSSQKEVTIDCSNWQAGMYVAKLLYGQLIISDVKFNKQQ